MARDRESRSGARSASGRRAAVEIGRLTRSERHRAGPEGPPLRPEPPPERAGLEIDGLEIDIRGEAPVTVRLTGDLDLRTASALDDRLRTVSGVDVVIDCAGLRFVDSMGVSLLVRIHNEFTTRGATLRLRGVTGVPQRTLEILGLTETLDIDLRER
jgi:anti-anti-sigma factor